MANEVPIKLAFQGDMSAVKKELKDLKSTIDEIVVDTKNLTSFGGIDQSMTSSIHLLSQLQGQLQAATTKTGNLKLDVLAKEFQQTNTSLEQYIHSLNILSQKGVPGAKDAIRQLINQIQSAYDPINQVSGTISRVFSNLGQDIIKTFNYALINKFRGAISGAFRYAQNLDRSLNDIRIVTNLNTDQMAEFAKQANKAAMALGATTLEYTRGALIYYQQGLSSEAVIERTNATIKLANTSGEAAEQISSYMTGIWNNFDKGSKSVEYYADVISYLGAVTAASNADIAEGVQAFAATASTVGLSFEYATGALTTLVDKTQQSASTIGNALKTIFARLSSVSLGETLEDGVNLSKYTKALATVGVDVLDANGKLKEMDVILDDLGKRWEHLSNTEKTALAQTVGGVRQYNNLISLMDNYGYFKELVNEAYDSEGYLSKQNAVYLESWAAASDQVQAAWQKIYDLLIDDQLLIKLTKGFADIVSGLGDLMNNLGGLKTLLPGLISLMLNFAGPKIAQGVATTFNTIKDFLLFNTSKGGGGLARDLRAQSYAYEIQAEVPKGSELEALIVKQQQMSEAYVMQRQKMTQSERILREEELKRNKKLIEELVEQYEKTQKVKQSLEELIETYKTETHAAGEKADKRYNARVANELVSTSAASQIATTFGGYEGFATHGAGKEQYFNAQEYVNGIVGALNNSPTLRNSELGIQIAEKILKAPAGKDIPAVKEKWVELAQEIKNAVDQAMNDTSDAATAARSTYIENILSTKYGYTRKRGYHSFEKSLRGDITKGEAQVASTQKKIDDVTAKIGQTPAENTEAIEKLQQQLVPLNAELETEKKKLGELRTMYTDAVEGADKMAEATRQHTDAVVQDEQAIGRAVTIEEFQAKQRASLANNLTSIAQAGMALSSAVTTTINLFKTLGDSSIDLGTKLSTVAGGMTSLLFQISSLNNASRSMITSGLLGDEAKKLLEGYKTVNAAGEEVFVKGKGVIAAIGAGITDKLIPALQTAGPYIIAIGALILALKLAWDAYNKDAIEAEKAKKAAEEAAVGFENAKEKYSALKSSLEQYTDAQEAIEKLTRGTDEWAESIENANDQVLKMLDDYPELAKYLTSEFVDGKQILSLKEGYEEVLNAAQQVKENARMAKYATAIGANTTASQSALTDAGRDIKVTYTYTDTNGQSSSATTRVGSKDLQTVVNAIDEHGVDLLDNAEELAKATGLNMQLCEAMVKNKDAVLKLDGTLRANANKNDALAKAMYENVIANSKGSEAEKAAYMKLANTEDLSSAAEKLYNDKYKDGKGKADSEVQRAYAEAMGYSEVQNKSGNKAIYTDATGEQVTIDDSVARRYLAMQEAVSQMNDSVREELETITLKQTQTGKDALTAFLGNGQEGLNDLYLTDADRGALLGQATEPLISITDEQAQEAGYESAEKFIEEYRKAIKEYSQSGISADFDYGTEDFSKDDLEFLEEYTKRLMELNEESRKNYKTDQEFESAMRDMAVRMINMNDALEDFNKNIDDYRTKITKGVKGTEEYERALAAVRKNMSKLLDMDPSAFSEEFLTSKKNLDDMEKAANGDVKAFTRLQEAAAIDIVANTDITTEGAEEKLKQWISESEQFHELKVGATLDTTEAGQKLAELFTQMLATGEMTAEEVNAALSAIGFEPNVKYVEMPLSEVDLDKQTAYTTDSEGNMVAVTSETKLEKDSMVKVPVLNAKEIHYTRPNDTIKTQTPKGSGSGKKEKKDKKSGETEKKRYEVINNKLEETSELLTEIAGQKDRAFGADKIEKMEEEMDALNTQLDQYNTKLAEAKDWLEKDKKAMDAYGAKYDENGVITNYDQIMDKQIAIYNAAVDRYNNSAQTDADKERFEAAEKAYEKFLKAYEQYNETLDLVGELEQNVLDTIYKIQDEMLEIIDTKVQLNVEVNDRDIELIEYLMEQLEDKAYSAADAIALLGKEAANSLDKIAGYQEGIAEILSDVNSKNDEELQQLLQAGKITAEEYNEARQIGDAYTQQFLNGEISAEQYAELVHMDEAHMEKLKEYADAIKDETLKLQELRKEAYEKLGETIDQFNDDLDKQKDKIEKATSALENYRNIVDTFGKKNLGLDDDIFEQMSRAELKAAQATAAISKMAVDEAKRAMEELQRQVDTATSEEQKRLLQEQLDKATETYQDALDDWTGDLADAAEKVRDVFDDAIDAIVDKFDESVGGLFNNLADLQEAFDQASTLDDQYLDDYERIHQLNKLNKKINDSIDNGATVKSKQLLLSLQDEINKKEAEGVELSEYDLEVYQKRYELYLAQIALEEAQNAKSTVRMSRDNEGNWSYVYVADQAAMDKALEDYEDKLYQYAKLNEDYINNTQNTILSLEKEYQDALAKLDPTDPDYERKLAELQKYYNDRMAFYIQQLNNAFEANKEVAGYEEAEDWNVKQGFEDTLLGQLTGIASADEYAAIFGEAIDNATKAAEEKYQQYLDDLETTTADIHEIGETIGQAIADVENASDEAQANAGIIAETFKTAFEAALGELDAFTESYNADIDSMSFATARLLALINKLNEIKSGQTSNTDMPLPDTAYSDAALREVLGDELYDSITNKGTYDNIYGLANRNDTQTQLLEMEREYKITLNDNMETLGESINRMAEISAAGFGDLTSFLVDHTGKLEQQVTITANFPNAVNHAEIEEAFSNLVNMAAQFANRKN